MASAQSILLITTILLSISAFADAASAVSCYVCNSDNSGEADCADPGKLKQFIKACPPLPAETQFAGRAATACRKVLQSVGDMSNVVRECAYTGTEPVNGKRVSGSKGITLYLYQCLNKENETPCNSAPSAIPSLGVFALTSAILFTFLLIP